MKRYKLLKDYSTPDLIAKAGEIGEQTESVIYDENCKVWFDNGRYFFYLSQIKMHSTWFEELAPLPTVKERTEVTNIWGVKEHATDEPIGFRVCTNNLVSYDKFPAIKLLLERFLNNEFTVNIDGSWTVHSHDQKTDTVDELVEKERLWNIATSGKYKSFYKYKNTLPDPFDKPTGFYAKPPKPIVPLFTTEDGVKIFENSTKIWIVDNSFQIWSANAISRSCDADKKYFSSKDAAEQYVLENKPVFSLNDLNMNKASICYKHMEEKARVKTFKK